MKHRETYTYDKGFEDVLFVIPSQNKNNKDASLILTPLNGKPLLHYAIDMAGKLAPSNHVCVSTNDISVIKAAVKYGQDIPFKLPGEIYNKGVTDIDELILHAIDHYARKRLHFGKTILLSPYSAFYPVEELKKAMKLLDEQTDMVLAVSSEKTELGTPYVENKNGFLNKHLNKDLGEEKNIFWDNNVFSIVKTTSIRQAPRSFFRKIRKYELDDNQPFIVHDKEDIARLELLVQQNKISE